MPLPHRGSTRALSRAALPQITKRWAQPRSIATAPAVDHVNGDPFVPPPPPPTARQQAIRSAAPFSAFLTDTHARQHNYLRISLTERCNLRCTYCMPSEGVALSPDREILTTPEIVYLAALFINQGVTKIRLTGGEPTVRKDILPLMQQIGALRRNGLKELALTTNGISLHRKLEGMVEAGLTGVNISLDTLDPLQFPILTRRNGFEAVMRSIERVKDLNRAGAGIKLKINIVAMRGVNDDQIVPFVAMTETEDLEVRFIEYMPFGGNKWSQKKMLPYEKIKERIQEKWPTFERMRDERNAVSKTWKVPGFAGRVGFITSMTEDFCGTCNRLRITSDGNLKVCLHGNTEVSLRDLLRAEGEGEPMDEAAFEAIRQLELQRRIEQGSEGWITKERQLLDVIGAAVKRKKAKHAGMGELENMENRPMILIGKRKAASLSRSSNHPSLRSSRSSPWSRIPMHLLQPSSSQFQARLYSSSTDNADARFLDYFQQSAGEDLAHTSDSQEQHVAGSQTSAAPDPGSAGAGAGSESSGSITPRETVTAAASATTDTTPSSPAFGFQSLSGLFPNPRPASRPSEDYRLIREHSVGRKELKLDTASRTHGRHNDQRPSNRSREDYRLTPQDRPEPQRWSTKDFDEQSPVPFAIPDTTSLPWNGDGGKSSWGLGATEKQEQRPVEELKIAPTYGLERQPVTEKEKYRRPLFRKHSIPDQSSAIAPIKVNDIANSTPMGNRMRRTPNPFGEGATSVSRKVLVENQDFKRITPPGIVQSKAEKPWGLSKEDHVGVESFLEPGSQDATREIPRTTSDPERRLTPSSSANPATSSRKPSGGAKLTHLTSTGEAHMVDVGAKDSTRRVAVAFGYVQFNNDEPARLIEENANQKGDVLGVARIAGIMAAKRTSDIVPLCHPIALTKVEMDVSLHPRNSATKLWRKTPHGLVTIQALVECTGPTGVEMEALAAVSGAALTVYDMCKAVDKKMSINGVKVVYKSGGRSGLLCMPHWARVFGRSVMEKHGLEREERKAKDGDSAKEAVKAEGRNDDERESQLGEEVAAEHSSSPPRVRSVSSKTTSSAVDRSDAPRRFTRFVGASGKEEDYAALSRPSNNEQDGKFDTASVGRGDQSSVGGSSKPRRHDCKVCGKKGMTGRKLRRHFAIEHGTKHGAPKALGDAERASVEV